MLGHVVRETPWKTLEGLAYGTLESSLNYRGLGSLEGARSIGAPGGASSRMHPPSITGDSGPTIRYESHNMVDGCIDGIYWVFAGLFT